MSTTEQTTGATANVNVGATVINVGAPNHIANGNVGSGANVESVSANGNAGATTTSVPKNRTASGNLGATATNVGAPDHTANVGANGESVSANGRIGARRAGRIAFGTVLISGAAGLVINLCDQAKGIPGTPLKTLAEGTDTGVSSFTIVLASWILAFLIGGIVSNLRIQDGYGLRKASLVIPSIGVALMLPLLLHMPFLIGGGTKAFDDWAALAVIAVGLSHITTAVLMAVRAWRLADGKKPPSVGAVYGFGVLASVIPFGMFLLPEILVALTGLAFIPVLYAQETLARKDRADERLDEIPEAVAKFRAL